jgi:hypothetical protein
MNPDLSRMSGEMLLLMRVMQGDKARRMIDRELDRRALHGLDRRQIAPDRAEESAKQAA